jgi:hypothetical protein
MGALSTKPAAFAICQNDKGCDPGDPGAQFQVTPHAAQQHLLGAEVFPHGARAMHFTYRLVALGTRAVAMLNARLWTP